MKAILMSDAKRHLDEIYLFTRQVSEKYALGVRHDILAGIDSLEDNPLIAALELKLEDEPVKYRSLVIRKRYKAVYAIEADTIVVTDIWDCRQDPVALSRRTKK